MAAMTERRVVSSGASWEPLVGYSRAVRVGAWVSVSGTTAVIAAGTVLAGIRIRNRVDAMTYRGWLKKALFVIALLLLLQYAYVTWLKT